MQVNNRIVEESFQYTEDKKNMEDRVEEIADFSDAAEYCECLGEKISFKDELWEKEVEPGIALDTWLYTNEGKGSVDDRRRIAEIIAKQRKIDMNESENSDIWISLGKWEGAVPDRRDYILERRKILATIRKVEEYFLFMSSCFPDSYFSDEILAEMKYIENFEEHTQEITENLSVLNDEAVDLYQKYHDDLRMAMDILSKKLLECSPDPKHKKELLFRFSYEELIEGKTRTAVADIECSPHLKLIKRNSNLRIYFKWLDKRIANGEKVLIGRIGRHPYT